MTTINQESEDIQEAKSRDNTWKIATALLASNNFLGPYILSLAGTLETKRCFS